MKELEDRKLLKIIWKDNKEDFVIQKVRLQTEHLEEAYRYVGRKPKRGPEQECVIEISSDDVNAEIYERRNSNYLSSFFSS